LTQRYNNNDVEARSVEVYVATHKQIDFALPDCCKKIQVNAEKSGQWEGYLHDNDNADDNISLKNPNYCELTALYSMWKNCRADVQGLFHYRRFISSVDKLSDKQLTPIVIPACNIHKEAISEREIINTLKDYDVILPFPFPPYPLNVQEDLKKYCYWKDIKELCDVIKIYYPDYLQSLHEIFDSEHISYCNMFIARREFVNDYCEWLFGVLAKVEERISLEGYDTQHKRIYGYLAEVLLNVYIHRHAKKCKYFYMQSIVELSPVKSFIFSMKQSMRKNQFIYMIIRLINNNSIVRGFLNRYISLQKFLSDTQEATKFSGNVASDTAIMKSEGFDDLQTHKEGKISYITARLNDNYIVTALLIPDEPEKLDAAPQELLSRLEAQAKENNRLFMPRIILSAKTPESVKESLIESGVRILISD